MPPQKKRDVPSTPTCNQVEEQSAASPTKALDKKKVFIGATAMDEDTAPHKMTSKEERESRRLEREARTQRVAKQKEMGVK